MRRSLLLLALLGTASSAAAAPDPSAAHLQRVLLDLEPGSEVRIRTDATTQEGTVVASGQERLLLDDGVRRFAVDAADIRGLAVRERLTWRTAKYGAAAGGILLGTYGLLMGVVISADDDGAVPALGLAGLVGGAVGGGVLGGLAGSAIPRWRTLWGEAPAPAAAAPATSARTGGLALGAGWSGALAGGDGGGTAWQAQLRIHTTAGLVHGLELVHARPGTAASPAPQVPGLPAPAREPRDRVSQLGWRAELPVRDGGAGVTPFLCGGVGVYWWQDTYLGFSLGGGLRVPSRPGRPGLVLEARRHDNLQNLTETDPAHWTATASLAWRW